MGTDINSVAGIRGEAGPCRRSVSGAHTYRGAGERAVRVHGPMPREDGERVREADGGEHKQRGLGDLRPAAAPAPAAGSRGTQPGWVEQPLSLIHI